MLGSPHSKRQLEEPNLELEVALVKIARTLYSFVDSQEDSKAIADIDPLIGEFQAFTDNYANRTGRLHDDLGLELREWEMFKRDLLAPDHEEQRRQGNSNVDRRFVDSYGMVPARIIESLERELGIGR